MICVVICNLYPLESWKVDLQSRNRLRSCSKRIQRNAAVMYGMHTMHSNQFKRASHQQVNIANGDVATNELSLGWQPRARSINGLARVPAGSNWRCLWIDLIHIKYTPKIDKYTRLFDLLFFITHTERLDLLFRVTVVWGLGLHPSCTKGDVQEPRRVATSGLKATQT